MAADGNPLRCPGSFSVNHINSYEESGWSKLSRRRAATQKRNWLPRSRVDCPGCICGHSRAFRAYPRRKSWMHAVLFQLIGENCLTEFQIVAQYSEGHVPRMGAKPVGGFFLFQMFRRLGGVHAPTVLTVFTMTCAGLLKMFPSMYVTIFLAPSDESQHSPARRCLDDTIRGGESQAFAEIPLIFFAVVYTSSTLRTLPASSPDYHSDYRPRPISVVSPPFQWQKSVCFHHQKSNQKSPEALHFRGFSPVRPAGVEPVTFRVGV